MSDNKQGFKIPNRSDLERVFATHVGDNSTQATGEVIRLQQGWDAMGTPFYITMDGSEWIPSSVHEIGTKPTRVMLGSETLTLDSSKKTLQNATLFTRLAEISVLPHEGLAWVTSGDVDLAGKNFRATSPGEVILLRGKHEVADFVATSLAVDGVSSGSESIIYVEYYNIDKGGNFVTYLDREIVINFLDTSSKWQADVGHYSIATDFIKKVGGSTDWSSSIVSKNSWRVGDAPTAMTFSIEDNSGRNLGMLGIADSFNQDSVEYDSIDHAFYLSSSTNVSIYENGGQALSNFLGGQNRTNGLFEIRLGGTTLSYWFDGNEVVTRENALQSGRDYFAQITALEVNSAFKNVAFSGTNAFSL